MRFYFNLFSQDPSVTQVRTAATPGLEEYNPFTDAKPVSTFTANLLAMSSHTQKDLNNITSVHRIDLVLKRPTLFMTYP